MSQVLIVEDDPYFSGVLVEVLKAEGYSVLVRDRADSALVAARRLSPDLLLINQDLPDRRGLELIKDLRRSPGTADSPIVLMFDIENESIQGAIAALKISLLPKPFSVLDLPDKLLALLSAAPSRGAAPAPDSAEAIPAFTVPADLAELGETEEIPDDVPTDPTGGGLPDLGAPRGSQLYYESPPGALPDRNSLRILTQIWAEERDGVLRIQGAAEWVSFSGGEPLDAREAQLAEQALYRPGTSFQPLSQPPGDSTVTIAHGLLEAARRAADVRAIHNSIDRALITAGPASAVLRLPIEPALAGLIPEIDGQRSLRALCADKHLTLASIDRDLAALLAMGLVQLGAFQRRQAPTPDRPPDARPKRPYREPPLPGGSRVRSPSDIGALESASHGPPRECIASRSETIYERPGISDPSNTTRSMTSGLRGGGRAFNKDLGKMEMTASLRRLRKEVERLAGASDWTILSLPAKAPLEMVEQAGARMLTRYSADAARADMPEGGRVSAAKLVTLVGEALERIRSGQPREAQDPKAGKTGAEIIFDQGVRAAESENWERAVQCFTVARNQQLDAPATLAWLGWAIFKQAKKEDYLEEALELLQLASSFDPELTTGQFFLAVLEQKTGRDGDAFERLERLLMNEPDHPEAKALYRELDARRRAE